MKEIKSKIIDRLEFRGYKYIIRRLWYAEPKEAYPMNPAWYCGYVEIPTDDRLYEVSELSDILEEFNVHGGVSFVGCLDGIDGFLIGFDCNHAYDNPFEQDIMYVAEECMSLIKQIKKANEQYNVTFKIYNVKNRTKEEVLQYINEDVINLINKNSDITACNLEIE